MEGRWLGKAIYSQMEIFRKVLVSLLRPIARSHWLSVRKMFRSAIFEVSEPGQLLANKLGELTFLVDGGDQIIGRDVYVHGNLWDFDKFQKILNLIEISPNLLIDIGANIGTISIPAVHQRLFRKAIAIEPEPNNFRLLSANLALNNLEQEITLHNCAAGEQGELVFELSDTNYGDHRVAGKAGSVTRTKSIVVQSFSVDDLIPQIIPEETLIWIDTQGYEGIILKGAPHTFSKLPPVVLEFYPLGMSLLESFEPLKQSLIKYGYNNFYDLRFLDHGPMPLTEDRLNMLYSNLGESGKYTDLLVTK